MGIEGNYRSPQADRIVRQPNGLLRVTGTMRGLEQLKPFDPYREVSACTMSMQAGIDVEDGAVRDIDTGDWLRVSSVGFGETGAKSLCLKAHTDEHLVIHVYLDRIGDEPAAVAEFVPDAEEARVNAAWTGTHDLYFVFEGGGAFVSWQAFENSK